MPKARFESRSLPGSCRGCIFDFFDSTDHVRTGAPGDRQVHARSGWTIQTLAAPGIAGQRSARPRSMQPRWG
ncbi:MAG: hypothetical protein WB752_02570, partial [Pseudolabrys sp.]